MWMWILPEELIAGILSRLPVKSLLRFRCISKAWFALIKDPTFINMHLHSNTERTLIMQTTMTRNLEDDRRLNLYYFLVNLSDEDQPVEVFPPFYDRHISSFPEIIGCCNGLVCIRSYEHKRTVIWNPSIRKYKKLPSEPTLLAPRCRSYFAFRGKDFAFGYDPVNNDYKVLKIAQYFESHESNEFEVNVYSLKAHSWRRVEDEWPYKHLDVISSGPVYLNGAFRWLVKTQAEESALSHSISPPRNSKSKRFRLKSNQIKIVMPSWLLGLILMAATRSGQGLVWKASSSLMVIMSILELLKKGLISEES
ncbi:F-box/kelch-repeat protein At3g06240-like [Alnus glutinosa]|uniref:F-box/kelch-repeat protein At3g06240-like n=1 Tax=Alnus glutinosa TaxID=3517 RepID=UPI002D76F6E5|nr:F-box/kelch-repeat protein At3g06240-like [Alnus glutinosa]